MNCIYVWICDWVCDWLRLFNFDVNVDFVFNGWEFGDWFLVGCISVEVIFNVGEIIVVILVLEWCIIEIDIFVGIYRICLVFDFVFWDYIKYIGCGICE